MRIREFSSFAKTLRPYPDARPWIATFRAAATTAAWQSIDDARRDYPSADGVVLPSGATLTIFNVKGNTYRLLTSIYYPGKLVVMLEVLTHAEYDKQRWKSRY